METSNIYRRVVRYMLACGTEFTGVHPVRSFNPTRLLPVLPFGEDASSVSRRPGERYSCETYSCREADNPPPAAAELPLTYICLINKEWNNDGRMVKYIFDDRDDEISSAPIDFSSLCLIGIFKLCLLITRLNPHQPYVGIVFHTGLYSKGLAAGYLAFGYWHFYQFEYNY